MSPSSLVEQESQVLHLHATSYFLLLLLLSLLIAILYLKRKSSRSDRFPPGPPRFPIIGNLHQLGPLPHRSLRRLSDVYGPLMLLQLGQITTLVVSSAAHAREVLKTHDLAFCSRPRLSVWQKLSYGGLDVAFGPYSDYWIQMRKLSTVEFFSSKRAQLFQPVREEEVRTLVRNIALAASEQGGAATVNLSEMFLCLQSTIICRALFGKRYAAEGECRKTELGEMITETAKLTGGFVAGDFFPSIQDWLNVMTGMKRRLDKNFKEMDEFLERELAERERDNDGGGRDFASVLVRLQKDASVPLTRDHIKAILTVDYGPFGLENLSYYQSISLIGHKDFKTTFIAGADAIPESLVWTMAELMRNPKVLAKVQEEIQRIAKGKEQVEEGDLQHLKYLNSVVKESLRLHPSGPLLVPHESREDCQIDGYNIPTGTRVYINAWAIARDSNTWESPEEFVPERFEKNCVDYKGHNFELVPFGSGRRICPGMGMAMATMELTLANLLYEFNWALPSEMSKEDIDMSESFGITVSKKFPLILVATPAK